MARLTEEMVVARTKISNLGDIKKLNCWGGELEDVSLLRRMSSVEVLSLSVNNITTLADFQYCPKLRELYVRKNNIRDLNEVSYLKSLPSLRNLWLGENPCAKTDLYRLTVLKALPYLEKLDDVVVQPEEVQDAFKKGLNLIHPEEDEYENGCEEISHHPLQICPQKSSDYDNNYSSAECEPSHDQVRNQHETNRYLIEQNGSYPPPLTVKPPAPSHRRPSQVTYEPINPTNTPKSSPSESTNICGKCQSPISPDRQVCGNDNGVENNDNHSESSINQSNFSPDAEYSTGHHHEPSTVQYHPKKEIENGRRGSSSEGSGRLSPRTEERLFCRALQKAQRDLQDVTQKLESERQGAHYRRPVSSRTSNLLTAVMCLVKELDYPSLEVLEVFIRLQMEEYEG